MSTTPRTDAFAAIERGLGTGYFQALDLASKLERELAALQKRYTDDVTELNARLIQRREDYAAHSVKQAQEMQSLRVQLEQSQAREKRCRDVLAMDQPCSLITLLLTCADGLDHMFEVHQCDADGWESWNQSRKDCREVILKLSALFTRPAPPVVPLEEVKPIREALERYRMRLDDGKHDQSAEKAILIFDTKYPAL